MTLAILKVSAPLATMSQLRTIANTIAIRQRHEVSEERLAAWVLQQALQDPTLRARVDQLLQDAGLLPARGEDQ